VLPLALAAGVTAGVYVWAKAITPDYGTSLFGQTANDTFPLKSWLATALLALAMSQVITALWLYGKLLRSRPRPARLGTFHRLIGAAAILVSLPIAYHCLFAYGFRDFDTRTTIHSLAGCFFYGVLAAKIACVRLRPSAGWALPLAGGTLFTVIVVLWYSSAAWYFNDSKVPLFDSGGGGTSSAPSYSGPSPSPARAAGGRVVRVDMKGIQFAPRSLTVKAGQTVVWTNRDSVDHNVTATRGASFKSSNFGAGGTYRYRPSSAGTIAYVCTIHPNMTATLTVR
jgi:plastocyanin